MSTTTDRAAQTMLAVTWPDESNRQAGTLTAYPYQVLAQALADAGLLATPERDAEQRRAGAVEALREAADTVDNQACSDGATCHEADAAVLRIRARRIEEQR